MIVRSFLLCAALVSTVHAAQWEPSLASIASLRTGGAKLVSSDAASRDGGNLALITYWEVRTTDDLSVYRCIDVVDAGFSTISEQCWSALRPTGRGPTVIDEVRSSDDICGRPDDFGGVSAAAYCSFSEPTVIRTPYFSLMVAPFDSESLIAVDKQGRSLIVTGQPWPSSVFFEVKATEKRTRDLFADVSSTSEIQQLQDDETVCEARRVGGRDWIACQASGAANTTTYLIEGDTLYEVSYSLDKAEAVQRTLESMFNSLDTDRTRQQ